MTSILAFVGLFTLTILAVIKFSANKVPYEPVLENILIIIALILAITADSIWVALLNAFTAVVWGYIQYLRTTQPQTFKKALF